jgi:hypothetical protein
VLYFGRRGADVTEDAEKVATLTERSVNQGKRIDALESNQKWGVVTILGLMAKALFDFFQKGAGQ